MQDWTRRSRVPGPRRLSRSSTRTTALASIALPGILLVAQQNGVTSALDPNGPRAGTIATSFWILLAASIIIFIIFVGLFLIGTAKGNPGDQRSQPANEAGIIPVLGLAIPAIILLTILGATLWILNDMATPVSAAEETITVTGHQWWWEVEYPDHGFTTANEIHIPVGKEVHFKLTSADVIHSFWVPSLAEKVDMFPGKTNNLVLKADNAGEYRGQCAEFCGVQHAHMILRIFADPEDTYTTWINDQQADAKAPDSDLLKQGEQVFLKNACLACHTVGGTDAKGKVGPDLTHLASRSHIGAGMLENTRGNLAGWIVNNQSLKPGNTMPDFAMDPKDLQALIAWLESLK